MSHETIKKYEANSPATSMDVYKNSHEADQKTTFQFIKNNLSEFLSSYQYLSYQP